jgi:predicted transcriptional regulator of viral defense system
MSQLDQYIDQCLSRGRAYFSREAVEAALGPTSTALSAAITRLIKRHKLANPRHGFYLILRPEDQVMGAPDPVQWIDALMRFQNVEYRISLLRAAAFHGAAHQAAMVFQVIAPKQLRDFEIGRHRLQFIYQDKRTFAKVNTDVFLAQLKSSAGFSHVAGVELTLLDCARYFHKAMGISGVAQIVLNIGDKARPDQLADAASAYESSAVRRLGYLLDRMGYERQAAALLPFVARAKTFVPLDPSAKTLIEELASVKEKDKKWKLIINEEVEIDL